MVVLFLAALLCSLVRTGLSPSVFNAGLLGETSVQVLYAPLLGGREHRRLTVVSRDGLCRTGREEFCKDKT